MAGQVTLPIQYVGNAARHTGGKIATRLSQHDHAAARHVLTAVISHRLNDGLNAAVAHAKALASLAVDIRFAGRRSVKSHVADDDIVLRLKRRARGRVER